MSRLHAFLGFAVSIFSACHAWAGEPGSDTSSSHGAAFSGSSTVFIGEAGYLAAQARESRDAAKKEVDALFLDLQDLKRRVIDLNRDLRLLEEELLFPANTQLVVFVSMDIGEFFTLESVKLKVDGEVVSAHLYSDKERYSLYRGGMQRLYVGNVSPGEHEIMAVFTGKGPQGQDYKRASSLSISKLNGPKYVELAVVDSQARLQPEFQIKEW